MRTFKISEQQLAILAPELRTILMGEPHTEQLLLLAVPTRSILTQRFILLTTFRNALAEPTEYVDLSVLNIDSPDEQDIDPEATVAIDLPTSFVSEISERYLKLRESNMKTHATPPVVKGDKSPTIKCPACHEDLILTVKG